MIPGGIIRKTSTGYAVYSHTSGKKLSKEYKSQGEAAKRLRQIQYFKHIKTKNK